jgi:SSS family solute:Na+ symporter
MHTIDWTILCVFCVSLAAIALYVKRFSHSVVDFLAANRCAGRYLLTVAEGAAGLGAISVVAQLEIYYSGGFTPAMWEMLNIPMWLVLSLAGWIIYRFRETRALTMAQFLELRYGRGFRKLAGITAFVAGIVNYGIFPAVTARFFLYVFGWPQNIMLLGWEVPTFSVMMFFMIGAALFLTMNGGQIVIIVTDFIQGQFINIVLIGTTIYLLCSYNWSEFGQVLQQVPDGASKVNPFDTARAEDFNLTFFMIALFSRFYGYMCWQGAQGYNASARNPHEARMARILSQWRATLIVVIPMIFALAAYLLINGSGYADVSAQIQAELALIPTDQVREQMTSPIAIRYLLPAGLLGLFVTMMFASGISTDSTYMHSWGSIFLQDVVMPFRDKPFSQKTHLRLLRFSIFGVAIFVFFFSLLFRQTEYIILFFMLTGSLFTAGAGTCIIGGLYWKRGTKQGAWAAMLTGITLVLTGFILDRVVEDFIFSYIQMVFISQFSSIVVYVSVSLLTGRGKEFNMDRMLHRGEYAVESVADEYVNPVKVSWFERRLGINQDFNGRDKLVYFATVALLFLMLATFFGTLAWHLVASPTHEQWMVFWKYFVFTNIGILSFAALWMLLGGAMDLRKMFALLSAASRDVEDDGFVVHGHNAGEEHLVEAIAEEKKSSEKK